MSTWTVFDVKTRRAVMCVTCPKQDLHKRVRAGQVAISGRHRGAVRLNDAGEVEVDRSSSTVDDQRRNARRSRVEELERRQTRRAERELLLAIAERVGLDLHESYLRLKAISDEIESLRPELRDPT